ncbi:hypothetical protein AgCh_024888 [Apium graveolens]
MWIRRLYASTMLLLLLQTLEGRLEKCTSISKHQNLDTECSVFASPTLVLVFVRVPLYEIYSLYTGRRVIASKGVSVSIGAKLK